MTPLTARSARRTAAADASPGARRRLAGARAAARAASLAALLIAGAAVLALGALRSLGFATLVVRSGSMEPAISTGDVVVTQMVPAAQARPGDVVTFRDPSRGGSLVTHRAVRVARDGADYEFVTKGDANTGIERWSVEAYGAEVGVMVTAIPHLGFVLAWLGGPGPRTVLLGGGGLALATLLLSKIWGVGGAREEPR